MFPLLFLLGCLGWWTTQRQPDFAADFSAYQWAFFQAQFPVRLFQLPRGEQLFFFISLLLALLAAAELGRSAKFRRYLKRCMGLSGMTLAIFALGQRWLNLPSLPWVENAGGIERFNVTFFHHSSVGACLNLAWPLLVFQGNSPVNFSKSKFVLGVGTLIVVAMASPLWHSRSTAILALILFVAGTVWRLWARRHSGWVFTAIVGIFVVVFAGQFATVERLRAEYPDNWFNAEITALNAPLRDTEIRARSETRGDRLVPSPAPDRPSAWLAAIRMAGDFPWIGLGPGAWLHRSALYSNDSFVNTFFQYRQFAHHDLLQTAAEWGGLCAIAWLVIWGGAFWRGAASQRHGVVLALLGMGLHSQLHFPLQVPALQLWTAFLLGLAWSPSRRHLRSHTRLLSPRSKVV